MITLSLEQPAPRPAPKKIAAFYVRVSTKEQNLETQLFALQDYAHRRGISDVIVYGDEAISGATDRRPKLDQLMLDARRRRFDVVLVTRFDRFARSTTHLLKALDEFQSLGIDFVSINEAIDTTTPMGVMIFTMVSALGQFERSIIQERVKMGLQRARKQGKQLGRSKTIVDRNRIIELRSAGKSAREIAGILKVGKDTVLARLREFDQLPHEKTPPAILSQQNVEGVGGFESSL